MSRILIIGSAGQLGSELMTVFPGMDVIGADLDCAEEILDICDTQAVTSCLQRLRPQQVILTAAFHEPALCEEDPLSAMRVNAVAAAGLAELCNDSNIRLVYMSTDYVFGAERPWPLRPFKETDPPSPLNKYGRSKAMGETLVSSRCPNSLIIRSASLYGLAPCRGKEGRNFVELMLAKAREGGPIRIVNDEFTSPTNAADLARQISLLTLLGCRGIYHVVSKGSCTWYEFARAIFEEFDIQADWHPVLRKDFPDRFPRPSFSLLDTTKLAESGLDCMPHWRDGLKRYAAARSVES
ncbi:MAG: dTDP-4-dehydrorhamnose reductase [Candidatus Hydrogenedens sp.]|jgi:dTDP-4-dehydrorhamnose reductase|nr:dTDP-4-dehydrorhamnose reductase [Candidatus Hydrogenedens sp.]